MVYTYGEMCVHPQVYVCDCTYVCVYLFYCKSWQSSFRENNDVFYPRQKNIEHKLSGS